MSERIIMGIDPGTIVMGYGLIEVRGQEARLLALGVISLSKYEDHYLRLKRIFERVQGLIDEFHPDELAIEAPLLREERPEYAQARPRPRRGDGSSPHARHPHH